MLQDQCRIRVFGKLCGGGGDGGSTGAESRDAYLKMYQLPKADKVFQRTFRTNGKYAGFFRWIKRRKILQNGHAVKFRERL